MAIALLTRLAILWFARSPSSSTAGQVLHALAIGEVYDLLAALWLLAPLMVYLTAVTDRWYRRRINRRFLEVGFFVAAAVAVFVAAAEYFFFDEFTGRFNFVAVDYLIFPTEVVNNIAESYPLFPVLVGVALMAALVVRVLQRPLDRILTATTTPGRRGRALLVYATALGALTLTVRPEWARVSEDRELNEVALNGYYTWWLAFMGQDAPYDGWYASASLTEQATRLRTLLREPQLDTASLRDGTTLRRIVATRPERRFNVVVVLEESLGSLLVGALHPRDTSLTPHYDSLIAEGTLLSNVYSTGNRTVRALEATTAGIPPLPGISIVRRPASRDLFTLPSVLRSKGYSTTFIYGGRALFDGMGSYMRNNGMERVIEQKDFPDTSFTTAWGVADELIFDRALVEMDAQAKSGKPFFNLILSVSNHKPYTYPRGRIAADPDKHWRTNAVQYADYALGRFMRQARTHAWFDSTLFVLMGDHGARVYGAAEIPLRSYEIPVLFYQPGIVPAGKRIPTLLSSMDLPATILAYLGMSYESRFVGLDAFAIPEKEGRALMTHNNSIAMMRGDYVAVLGLRGSTSVYRYSKSDSGLTRVAVPDSTATEAIRDAIAYYSAADRLYRSGAYRFGTATRDSVQVSGRN
ncbi:MAG: Phosphoglycerol transferase I [Gemmatimonadaceae bacterium]|nr:Phosphoglycerol transferase I [Gemmatimonadaceae bacterium]